MEIQRDLYLSKIISYMRDEQVKVYIEKPDEKDCFHQATCYLPSYKWENIEGFSSQEMVRYQDIVESTAHLILRFAEEEGVE